MTEIDPAEAVELRRRMVQRLLSLKYVPAGWEGALLDAAHRWWVARGRPDAGDWLITATLDATTAELPDVRAELDPSLAFTAQRRPFLPAARTRS